MTWLGASKRATAVPGGGSQQAKVDEAIGALQTAVNENGDNVLFLWTGGKEANCIAKMLQYDVGDELGTPPVPFGIIDTGNAFDEMYEFRGDYLDDTGDRGADTIGPPPGVHDDMVIEERYDDLLEHVIWNDCDPRGYHGEWTGNWRCPECKNFARLRSGAIRCRVDDCRTVTELHSVQRQHTKRDEWGVPESCGALKVVPIRRFIEDHGYDVLIMGRRGDDPLVGSDDEDGDLPVFEEKHKPVPHQRVNPLSNWTIENVYAYVKMESVSLPSLYTEDRLTHTDAECCVDTGDVGEYGAGGRDPEKVAARDRLEDLGYV